MSDLEKIAHLYKTENGGWNKQTVADHCRGTSERAGHFASVFGMRAWGEMLGQLHDRGKESIAFQDHIRHASGYDTSKNSIEPHLHSPIGAVLAHRIKLDALFWLSNPIAGHHRGLYDTNELELVLKSAVPEEVDGTIPNIDLTNPPIKPNKTEASHLTRMLFSCLVDADWLDTEQFMRPDIFALRGRHDTLTELKERLNTYLKGFSKASDNKLNRIRTDIQRQCAINTGNATGFYELTVPTGGGKTIASIVWAINHALRHGKKRIIIAIPFTSIIVQTAHTLKSIFGSENVIEHHSNLNEDTANKNSLLACENWDAPIVVTTNVQLFESMFSNKPSKCRKLHSLCNSVVILDEAQSLPLTKLQPIVDAMKTYVNLFGTSFLFCTASQPMLDGERHGMGNTIFQGIAREKIAPVITTAMNLHSELRRARLQFDPTPSTIDEICHRIASESRALCIVNSRKTALEIFEHLPSDGAKNYHLSRMMCPAHILETLTEIKRELTETDNPVRVISTQLIEAGVDIDFPVVFRQFAGLDSLLQAAGRCNREGTHPDGITHVFTIQGDRTMGSIGFAIDAMKRLRNQHPDYDWFSPKTMREYYRMLYANTPSFDDAEIGLMLDNPLNCNHETASNKFKMIDESGVTVIVPYGESYQLVRELQERGPSRTLSRKLGRYSVSIRKKEFDRLLHFGLIEQPSEGFFSVTLPTQYDTHTGLKTSNEYLEITMII
jgi:CRISPR-associated endonuclease/helicase Cas3